MIVLGLLIGLILGLLARGRITRLIDVRLRWVGLIFAAVFGVLALLAILVP